MFKHKLLIFFSALFPLGVVAQTVPTATIFQDCRKNGITSRFCDMENGYMWVDLGLSVKWATCNVGATTPEGYGDYFAWGETSPKTTYSWNTYKYGTSSTTITKYCTSSSYGTVDNKTTLELSDNAAHVNWGGAWRMPTKAELDELRNSCTWTWTTQNGVDGYQVAGKNGNSIFLPAAGYRNNSDLFDVGSGVYRSSSLSTYGSSSAYCLYFYSGGVEWSSYDSRCDGRSVRPVCPATLAAPTNYTLTLYAEGCDTPNSFVCASGQQVNIAAEEIDGYQFVQWNDGNTDNPRSIIVTQDSSFIAEFKMNEIKTYAEHGTIFIDKEDRINVVQLEAVPEIGYAFVKWNDGSTDNPRVLPKKDVANYTAYYTEYYPLVINGDFENGNDGTFTSTYTYFEDEQTGTFYLDGHAGANNLYTITVNAQGFWRDFLPIKAHSGQKYALFDAGYGGYAWRTNTVINPNLKLIKDVIYDFSFWVACPNPQQYFGTPAELQFKICWKDADGNLQPEVDLGPSYKTSYTTGTNWTQVTADWKSPVDAEWVQIGVYDKTFSGAPGNDFCLDDIMFEGPMSSTPSLNTTHGKIYQTGVGVFEYVSLTAVPDEHYRFASWGDGETSNPRFEIIKGDVSYTALFEPIKFSVHVSASGNGNAQGTGTYMEGDTIILRAIPNYGYNFTQWNDGNTDNPRYIVVTQDTIFMAKMDTAFSGLCGDNLYWQYNNDTLSITGSGAMYDGQPWYLFVDSITTISLPIELTTIGASAFANIAKLNSITIPTLVTAIGDYAFDGCRKLFDIYCLAAEPPVAQTSSFANYNVYLHVPCNILRDYQMDAVFGSFKYIECIGAESTQTTELKIEPTETEVTITWPKDDNASSYSIEITKDGVVFCTLKFNAQGQLIGIAFAPSRGLNNNATDVASGFKFTITNLTPSTTYDYVIVSKDASDQVINSYSGTFTTKGGVVTKDDQLTDSPTERLTKVIKDNHLLIFRGGKIFNAAGVEL